MKEIWKDIAGYEGKYQVSNLGRIRSLDRIVYNQGRYYFQNGKILKAGSQKWEYMKKYNLKRLPTNLLMYLTSGKVPNMPIVKAKSVKQFMKYKTDHWFPVQIVTKEEYDRA